MTEHKRLTTKEKYPHGAEGVSKDKLTGKYCRGVFEATACVEKLAEYETAEDEGRLVVLPASMNGVDTFGKVDGSYWCRIPCNIGDRVYRIVSNYHTRMKTIREVEVSRIAVTNSETQLFTDEIQGKMILGKTVFLTREEAEKALEEMEKDE